MRCLLSHVIVDAIVYSIGSECSLEFVVFSQPMVRVTIIQDWVKTFIVVHSYMCFVGIVCRGVAGSRVGRFNCHYCLLKQFYFHVFDVMSFFLSFFGWRGTGYCVDSVLCVIANAVGELKMRVKLPWRPIHVIGTWTGWFLLHFSVFLPIDLEQALPLSLNVLFGILILVMRKFAVSQSFCGDLENYRKTTVTTFQLTTRNLNILLCTLPTLCTPVLETILAGFITISAYI